MNKKKQSRRNFIKVSSGAIAGLAAFPYIIPSTILGKNKLISPSDKIRIGCIGMGWQGTGNMEAFLRQIDTEVVAVCDIDKGHLKNAKNIIDTFYGNNDCKTYHRKANEDKEKSSFHWAPIKHKIRKFSK